MPDKTLLRGVNWVGDAVMTMPAIRALKKAMPDASLSLLVKPQVAPLFERNPFIDEVIVYGGGHRGLMGRIRLAGELRKRGFSQALLLQNAFDAALIAYLAGIPRRVGYARDMRSSLLTQPIPYRKEDRSMHHIDYYLELLRRAGIEAAWSAPWIYLALEERTKARERLAGLKRPVVGVHPGAAYGSAKQWLPERSAEVAERVAGELGGTAVLFGGPSEKRLADEITGRYKGRPDGLHSLVGQTTLRELAALFSECDALLTNDSGPMHIGYAVMAPLVAIFGSTDPALTGPPEGGGIVLDRHVECSPCFLRKCRKKRVECMEAITSEEAFAALKGLLPKRRAVFFDRDGTLCEDAHYLSRWEDFKVLSELDSINTLKNKDYLLVGISNQSGVARGIVEEGFVREVNGYFIEKYGFDGFYYCPHHPDEHCQCRKPEPGLVLQARAEHRIDLKGSFVVGDRDDDMLLARAVGAKAVLVQTGKQKESPYADFTARDMKEAVGFILGGGAA